MIAHEVTELVLYIDNHRPSYGRWLAACRNLERHRNRGDYDPDKALRLMEKVATEGAKAYHAEHGSPGDRWFDLFNVEVRRLAARHLLIQYEDERSETTVF